MNLELIIVDNFYKKPDNVRKYALEQKYYHPYEKKKDVATGKKSSWETSYLMKKNNCPFRSSNKLISTFERLTGDKIDMEYWNREVPVGEADLEEVFDALYVFSRKMKEKRKLGNDELLTEIEKKFTEETKPSMWNCCFQVKYDLIDDGIHNHIQNYWQHVGETGWSGIIYLNKDAPIESGLRLWRNKYGNDEEWFTDSKRWELVDSLANIYNRLILFRGPLPHSGGRGFGDSIDTGRLFQTFFFRLDQKAGPEKKSLGHESIDIKL